jgi:hypothetical protein
MIRLVWRSITERKARSLLLLVAVLVVSASFGLLLSAAETSKVTVDQNLEKYWRSTYDILVRPPGNRSLIEEKYDLVQTYHLGNILGGISFEQFEAIKRIPGVDPTLICECLSVSWRVQPLRKRVFIKSKLCCGSMMELESGRQEDLDIFLFQRCAVR